MSPLIASLLATGLTVGAATATEALVRREPLPKMEFDFAAPAAREEANHTAALLIVGMLWMGALLAAVMWVHSALKAAQAPSQPAGAYESVVESDRTILIN